MSGFPTPRPALLLVLTVALAGAGTVRAQGLFQSYQPAVVVADPFIELHTGPGRGYPVFHVAGEGEEIIVLKRRTDWFKVRSNARRGREGDYGRGREGWVHVEQLRRTLDLEGRAIDVPQRGLGHFTGRRFESGVLAGDFGGARSVSGYVGFALNAHITVQLEASQILGDVSDGVMGSANILMYPFPAWRVSPYFTLGTGIIRTSPHTTIVQAEDRQDEIVHAGVGTNVYLTDRFMLRLEYKRHTVLTSRDENEEIDQWKAGFSVFF